MTILKISSNGLCISSLYCVLSRITFLYYLLKNVSIYDVNVSQLGKAIAWKENKLKATLAFVSLMLIGQSKFRIRKTNRSFCQKRTLLKVSKFRKQIFMLSFELKNERNYFLISALASKNGSNQKSEGTLLY